MGGVTCVSDMAFTAYAVSVDVRDRLARAAAEDRQVVQVLVRTFSTAKAAPCDTANLYLKIGQSSGLWREVADLEQQTFLGIGLLQHRASQVGNAGRTRQSLFDANNAGALRRNVEFTGARR